MNKEIFTTKVKEFCQLMNTAKSSNDATAGAIFERVKDSFTNSDCINAFDEMSGLDIVKFNYPTVMRYLRKYRDIRLSTEQKNRKIQEKKEAEEILSHVKIKEIMNDAIKNKGNHANTHIRPNAMILRNGKMVRAWVDMEDTRYDDAVTIIHEQRGEAVVRTSHINLNNINHMIMSDREYQDKLEREYYGDDVFVEEVSE